MALLVTPCEVAPPLSRSPQVGTHGGTITNPPPNCLPSTQRRVSPPRFTVPGSAADTPVAVLPPAVPVLGPPAAGPPPSSVVAAVPSAPASPVPGAVIASGGGADAVAGAREGNASASTSWAMASRSRGE